MKLAQDKLKHYVGGVIIALMAIIVAMSVGVSLVWSCVIGAVTASIVGGIKEYFDSQDRANHSVEVMDWIATTLGGFTAVGIVALFRVIALRLLLILMAITSAGCFGSRTAETGAAHGQINGQPVAIEWQRDSEGHTSITVPPIISAGASMLPSPWGELAAGALSLIAGGGLMAARAQKRRADEHKADADEGWAKATRPPNQSFTKTDGG